MSIRQRLLLTLPVLFLALGLGTGLLAYRAVVSELKWGLEEEVSSLAVGISEFVAAGAMSPAELNTALQRLLDFDQANILRVYRQDGALLAEVVDPRWVQAGPGTARPEIPEVVRSSMARREAQLYIDPLVFAAEQGLDENRGGPTAWLSAWSTHPEGGAVLVTIDASRLDAASTAVLHRFGLAALGLTLLGMLGAGLTAQYLSHQMRLLRRAAARVAEGDYGYRMRRGGLYEIREMANTLNTLSSLLEDGINRGRTLLLRETGTPDSAAMAGHYRTQRRDPRGFPVTDDIAGVRVAITMLGEEGTGDLFGAVCRQGDGASESSGGVAWAGRLAGEPSLTLAWKAEALQVALPGRFVTEKPEQVAQDLLKHMELETLEVVWWETDAQGPVQRLTWVRGEGAPALAKVQRQAVLPQWLRTFTGRERALLDGWFRQEPGGIPARADAMADSGLRSMARGVVVHLSTVPFQTKEIT